jgi:hypothetical protein
VHAGRRLAHVGADLRAAREEYVVEAQVQ